MSLLLGWMANVGEPPSVQISKHSGNIGSQHFSLKQQGVPGRLWVLSSLSGTFHFNSLLPELVIEQELEANQNKAMSLPSITHQSISPAVRKLGPHLSMWDLGTGGPAEAWVSPWG